MTDDGTHAAHDHGGHDHDHSATPCEDALKELYVYLDGELTEQRRRDLVKHVRKVAADQGWLVAN